jgi:hypothetical protein
MYWIAKSKANYGKQGIKIHISLPDKYQGLFLATIIGILERFNVGYKVVYDKDLLNELNNSFQKGKCIVVYPHEKITKELINILGQVCLLYKENLNCKFIDVENDYKYCDGIYLRVSNFSGEIVILFDKKDKKFKRYTDNELRFNKKLNEELVKKWLSGDIYFCEEAQPLELQELAKILIDFIFEELEENPNNFKVFEVESTYIAILKTTKFTLNLLGYLMVINYHEGSEWKSPLGGTTYIIGSEGYCKCERLGDLLSKNKLIKIRTSSGQTGIISDLSPTFNSFIPFSNPGIILPLPIINSNGACPMFPSTNSCVC